MTQTRSKALQSSHKYTYYYYYYYYYYSCSRLRHTNAVCSQRCCGYAKNRNVLLGLSLLGTITSHSLRCIVNAINRHDAVRSVRLPLQPYAYLVHHAADITDNYCGLSTWVQVCILSIVGRCDTLRCQNQLARFLLSTVMIQ